jgi:Zinc-binding
MPESNAAAKKRQQKANRAAGIGDEQGRLVKVKDPPKMSMCTVCHLEMKITKTNTELKAHATSKHNSTLDACFPGAAATAEEMIALATGGKGKQGAAAAAATGKGPTKADKKAKDAAGLDDLLNAGLTGGKKKDKK